MRKLRSNSVTVPQVNGHVASGRAVPSTLHDLAADVRTYHANVLAAFSTAANYAVEAGRKLSTAKQCAGHGRFGEFLRACEINDRTAARYMQLTRLVEQNGRGATDLAGVSIERAIKLLSPSKPPSGPRPVTVPKAPAPTARHGAKDADKRTGHADIIGAWMTAPPAEQAKAIAGIGLDAVLAAIPASWMPLLKERLADRQQSMSSVPAPASPLAAGDDLTIPTFLRREALKAEV